MARDWTRTIPAAVLAANGLTRGDVAGAGVATTVPERARGRHQAAPAARDISEAEWAGTGPKGRYPVPLQYTLWCAGWLCYQTATGFEARHVDGRVVAGAETRRELVRMVEGSDADRSR